MQRGGVAVGDGGWNLSVFVTDLQVERTLRVRGDVHIGGLMIRLVDELGRQFWHHVKPPPALTLISTSSLSRALRKCRPRYRRAVRRGRGG